MKTINKVVLGIMLTASLVGCKQQATRNLSTIVLGEMQTRKTTAEESTKNYKSLGLAIKDNPLYELSTGNSKATYKLDTINAIESLEYENEDGEILEKAKAYAQKIGEVNIQTNIQTKIKSTKDFEGEFNADVSIKLAGKEFNAKGLKGYSSLSNARISNNLPIYIVETMWDIIKIVESGDTIASITPLKVAYVDPVITALKKTDKEKFKGQGFELNYKFDKPISNTGDDGYAARTKKAKEDLAKFTEAISNTDIPKLIKLDRKGDVYSFRVSLNELADNYEMILKALATSVEGLSIKDINVDEINSILEDKSAIEEIAKEVKKYGNSEIRGMFTYGKEKQTASSYQFVLVRGDVKIMDISMYSDSKLEKDLKFSKPENVMDLLEFSSSIKFK